MKLVVVELPAKAKTIEKYLGPGHRVLASYGHVRDLPPKDGSVDPDDGFAMLWTPSPDRAKQLKAIADEAKKADTLILATDPDREGEAISWHVQEVLRAKKALPANVERVTFNAITKSAVTEAMAHPRDLDEDLIDAYRARRALDYLVGFTLSPILWRKLPGAKSAGRVQSVALRLIVDREREIELFKTAGILGGQRHVRSRRPAVFVAPGPARRAQARPPVDRQRGRCRCRQSGGRSGPFHRCVGRDQAVRPQSAAAVHHLDPSARSGAQARLFGQPHDARCPVALRGRPDHLHADRRRRHGARGGERGPQSDRQPLRRRLRARQAAPLHDQGQECAGSARGDPPDRLQPGQRRGRRPRAALQSGLQPRACQPDGVGPARAHDGRADRRDRSRGASRQRAGGALPGFPRALRRRPRRESRGRG